MNMIDRFQHLINEYIYFLFVNGDTSIYKLIVVKLVGSC